TRMATSSEGARRRARRRGSLPNQTSWTSVAMVRSAGMIARGSPRPADGASGEPALESRGHGRAHREGLERMKMDVVHSLRALARQARRVEVVDVADLRVREVETLH